VLNRGNNQENVFLVDENYRFFLKKWRKYILPYLVVLAYCLIPNHFHFLIKVKSEEEILKAALENFSLPKLQRFGIAEEEKLKGKKKLTKPSRFSKLTASSFEPPLTLDVNRFLEERFQRCLGSYAQAFNKQWNRTGSLFQKRFKRILVDSDTYLTWLIHYIHHNPIHHHFTTKYELWEFSSYNAIVSEHETSVKRDVVLSWFGGVHRFIEFHAQHLDYSEIKGYLLEEE
jgi:REP element-mobilizing transposase RayT